MLFLSFFSPSLSLALSLAKIGQKHTSRIIIDRNRHSVRRRRRLVLFLSLLSEISLSLLIANSFFIAICCALHTLVGQLTRRNNSISLSNLFTSTTTTMGSDTSKSKKRATQLTEEEIQLLLKNTHFNRQQILEWHQGFLVSILI